MSYRMISHYALKKAPINPSGPGALTEGSEKTASFISSSSKGASSSDRSCEVISRLSQFKHERRGVGVPKWPWKWERSTCSLSSAVTATP